jgi:hypothetical protein
MEHRWGQRRKVDVTVRVGPDPRSLHIARLISVSVSGAFLWTGLPLASSHTIYIGAGDERLSGLIEGRVVRSTDHGIGVEWSELAPAPVLRMLQALEPRDAATGGAIDEAPALDRLA